jgi:hypothetical protein
VDNNLPASFVRYTDSPIIAIWQDNRFELLRWFVRQHGGGFVARYLW